jgi:hypothetical protein
MAASDVFRQSTARRVLVRRLRLDLMSRCLLGLPVSVSRLPLQQAAAPFGSPTAPLLGLSWCLAALGVLAAPAVSWQSTARRLLVRRRRLFLDSLGNRRAFGLPIAFGLPTTPRRDGLCWCFAALGVGRRPPPSFSNQPNGAHRFADCASSWYAFWLANCAPPFSMPAPVGFPLSRCLLLSTINCTLSRYPRLSANDCTAPLVSRRCLRLLARFP